MTDTRLNIELRTSPHLKQTVTVEQIMRNVVYALLPVCAFAIYAFGISVLALLMVTTLTCIASESLFCRLAGKPDTVDDWSITITGLLLALTLPPGFPLWMAAVAAVVAVGLGKALFGGLGSNVMNPALVGRAFVQAAFPVAITTWTPAFMEGRFTEFIPSTLTLPFMQPPDLGDWLAQSRLDGCMKGRVRVVGMNSVKRPAMKAGVQVVMATGKAACTKARPTSAGLKGFMPRPPKSSLPSPVAATPPTATIQSGSPGGSVNP